MDSRIRKLEKEAQAGSEEAKQALQREWCRRGDHEYVAMLRDSSSPLRDSSSPLMVPMVELYKACVRCQHPCPEPPLWEDWQAI